MSSGPRAAGVDPSFSRPREDAARDSAQLLAVRAQQRLVRRAQALISQSRLSARKSGEPPTPPATPNPRG